MRVIERILYWLMALTAIVPAGFLWAAGWVTRQRERREEGRTRSDAPPLATEPDPESCAMRIMSSGDVMVAVPFNGSLSFVKYSTRRCEWLNWPEGLPGRDAVEARVLEQLAPAGVA